MADLTIGQLTKATEMTDDALLPIEQGGEARVITGTLIKQYARDGVQPEFILHSSTADSTKRFRITVDDTGTLTAAEVT